MNINRLPEHVLASYSNMLKAQRAKGNQAGPAREAGGGEGASGAARGDGVSLSAGVREFQRVRSHVQSLPDVRADRVAEVRSQLASGGYRVSDEALANRLVGLFSS